VCRNRFGPSSAYHVCIPWLRKSTLYVLASSGEGTPSFAGSGIVNFADESTQALSYNGFDWCNGPGALHPEAVLTGPNGRADVGPEGTAFIYNQDCDFHIYETVIAVDPSHAGDREHRLHRCTRCLLQQHFCVSGL
jgi:hypothetical protein